MINERRTVVGRKDEQVDYFFIFRPIDDAFFREPTILLEDVKAYCCKPSRRCVVVA